jgi:hypothetical protein
LRWSNKELHSMGRGCLLWALGVPLPIVLILWFFFFR